MAKFYIFTVDGKEVGKVPFRNKRDKKWLEGLAGVKIEVYDTDTERREVEPKPLGYGT